MDVGHDLKYVQNLNPVVLNMANARTPGGGYKSGSGTEIMIHLSYYNLFFVGAQEENLHRRTNYFQHLEEERKMDYPIPDNGASKYDSLFFEILIVISLFV